MYFPANLDRAFLRAMCLYQTCLSNVHPSNSNYPRCISMKPEFLLTLSLLQIYQTYPYHTYIYIYNKLSSVKLPASIKFVM